MLVIGDSHIRAYGKNENFQPLYLGAGKEANFLDWSNATRMLKACRKIEELISPKSVLLCLGEPDTRYALGLGWTPWAVDYPKDEDNFSFIDKCLNRYLNFIDIIKQDLGWEIYVQNIVLTRDPAQCKYIDYYNIHLARILQSNFIAFNDRLRLPDGTINPKFSWDQIHANNGIVRFIELSLNLEKINQDIIPNYEMKKHFQVNNQFNNFAIDTKSKSFTSRLKSTLKHYL